MSNVLSLFDGYSGAMVAFERANIPIANYYASETDKYAMQVSGKNYPDIIQLGCITKWREWELPKIDFIIGGSPCQGFSICGKGLNFEDPRSKLFFEFADIVKHYDPEYWMLENVGSMRKEWVKVISDILGVEPVLINSALVSAQNRNRYYWTNIKDIQQPGDRGIVLADILEDDVFTDKEKSYCITASMQSGLDERDLAQKRGKRQIAYIKNRGEWKERSDKSQCLDANYFKGVDNRGQRTMIRIGTVGKGRQGERIYSVNGKGAALSADSGGPAGMGATLVIDKEFVRKLTPLECERLQTLPDDYTKGVSASQQYKMLGNGFNIDTISHILDYIK